MTIQHIFFLAINAAGGIAVLGSYVFGIKNGPGGADALWGGVPAWLRPVYTVSMLLSAVGYFAFLFYILFHTTPSEVRIAGRFGFGAFYVIFLGILLPSAFWMPLTNAVIAKHRLSTWIAVRAVLVLVGLFSCALVWALLKLQPREAGPAFVLAVAGAFYFAFHTAVLDMLLWPLLFDF